MEDYELLLQILRENAEHHQQIYELVKGKILNSSNPDSVLPDKRQP